MPTPGAQMHTARNLLHTSRSRFAACQLDHLPARFPERLSGLDLAGRIALQLEQHPALEHVAEDRSAVAVRRCALVGGWEFDELGHSVRTLGDPRWRDARHVRDLDVSELQHLLPPYQQNAESP